MIHVKLFHRPRRKSSISIEAVFNSIKTGLKNKVIFDEYHVPANKHQLFAILQMKRQAASINHIVGDVHFLALGLPAKGTILTIHDIGHYERNLKGLRKTVYRLLWLTWPLRKVDFITCISEFTKRRLVESFGIPPNNIQVIYNPCPPGYNYNPRKPNLERPVILQIGNARNKNREGLIHATHGIKCKLKFIGEVSEEHKILLRNFGTDYSIQADLTDEEMMACYKEADIVYFASYYEGFGLPIIEAQAIGRPVITSNLASMPEIAGDAAVFVNPYNIVEIRAAIKLLKSNDIFRSEIVTRGLINVQRFDLKRIADQYYQLYSLVNKRSPNA